MTEEEVFRRGNVTDTWRHTTLPMSLRAVAATAADRIIEPSFQAGLVAPQDLPTIHRRTVTMNSWAGSLLLSVGLLTGATIVTMATFFQHQLDEAASRALAVRGMTPPVFSTFVYTCIRLPGISNGKIATVVFAGFTALLLPIVTFLLA